METTKNPHNKGGHKSFTASNSTISPTEPPDFEQAIRFLTLLDESAERWTFQTFDDNKDRKDPTFARVLHGTLKEHWQELCELSNRGAGIFITVNETNGRGRKVADMIRVRAVFQETDRPGTPEPPLQPHLVVESSPGKYHRYFLVDGGHRFDRFEQVMARMVLDFGSDPNAKDRARVLRLPGFPHQKDPANPRRVRVIHENGERPYSWEEITAAIPPLLIKKKTADIPPGTGIDDPVKVRSALAALNPDMEYLPWLQVGMALHHVTAGGAEGLALWDEWSARGSLYRPGETAYKWSSFGNTNGRPVTLGTVFKLASATGWRWKDPPKGNGHDDAPLSDYSDYPEAQGLVMDAGDQPVDPATADSGLPEIAFTADDFMVEPSPAPFLITGLFPLDVCFTNATGGTGKSTFELFKCIHVILGLPFLGMPVERPGPVVYVTAEDDGNRIKRRLYWIMEAMALTPTQRRQVAENFKVVNLCGLGYRLAALDRYGNITGTNLAEQLIKQYRAFAPVLVEFDPVIKFSPGERHVNDGEDAVINAMMFIGRELSCATHGIHHVSKMVYRDGIIDHLAGRGGSAMGDGARAVYSLLQVDKKTPKLPGVSSVYQHYLDAGELMALFVTKLTDGKRPRDPFILRRNGWTFELLAKPTPESVEQARRQQQQDKARLALEKLTAYLKEWSFSHHTQRDLESARGEIGLSRDDMRDAISLGIRELRLVERDLPESERRGARKTGIYLAEGGA